VQVLAPRRDIPSSFVERKEVRNEDTFIIYLYYEMSRKKIDNKKK